MFDYFVRGGALMYPLLACSLLSAAVIVERLVYFIRTRDNRAALSRFEECARTGRLTAAAAVLEGEKGTTAVFLRRLLEGRPNGGDGASPERTGDTLLRELGRGIAVLELVERLAPLLGFLGTVTGMVAAFARVASADGPVKPSLIADGIWQALITTAAGLIVAIPALVAVHFFTAVMKGRAARMRAYGELLLAAREEKGDDRACFS